MYFKQKISKLCKNEIWQFIDHNIFCANTLLKLQSSIKTIKLKIYKLTKRTVQNLEQKEKNQITNISNEAIQKHT